ncbi:hypothetical protein NQ314_007202, partial [Rhamnusium bicolor]
MNFEIDTSSNSGLVYKSDYDLMVDIPVFNASKLSYNDFFQNYMLRNAPCIIKNITDLWETSLFWLKHNKPNFDYLLEKYGQSKVTIYNCSERYYNSQKTREAGFDEYLNYWKNFNELSDVSTLDYLKDWHLKLINKDDNFYEVPIYFASDWLNEYYTQCLNDDYRFVYMGPKNTCWSANVCGRKKWLFFPPVVQNPGEVIFVPSGWHHQVWNLDDTISINHNWVNGCNIKTMLNTMRDSLELVRKEIEDCKSMDEFEQHCQVMLNASFGMDYYKFYEFIKFIGISRIEMIIGNKSRI